MSREDIDEYRRQDLRSKILDKKKSYLGKDFVGVDARGVDFSGLDLRDADFTGAKLIGANFTDAKIAGTKFNKAQLKKANFTLASTDWKAGSDESEISPKNTSFCSANIEGANFTLSHLNNADFSDIKTDSFQSWYFIVILSSILLSLFAGFTSAIVTTFLLYYFRIAPRKKLPEPSQGLSFQFLCLVGAWSTIFVLVVRTVINNLSSPTWVEATVGLAIAVIVLMLGLAFLLVKDSQAREGSLALIVSFLLIFLVLGQTTAFFASREQWLVEHWNFLGEKVVKGLGTEPVSGTDILWANSGEIAEEYTDGAWLTGFFGAFIGALIGCLFARLAIIGDKRFSWLWTIVFIPFITFKGTRFYKADLTSANFDHAYLRGTSLDKACIFKARWDNARCLDCVSLGDSYLRYPQIRYLVVRKSLRGWHFLDRGKNAPNAQSINLDGLDLEGINLQHANLQKASLVRTNLSRADLAYAELQDANLQKSLLDDADLRNAYLTGACIEAWTINEGTQLQGVNCDYVFLKDVADQVTGYKERIPDIGTLQPNEFEALFQKDSLSIQLYIRDTYGRGALSEAFRKLSKGEKFVLQGFDIIGESALVRVRADSKTSKKAVSNNFYHVLEDEINSYPDEESETNENQSWREFVLDLAGIIASNSGNVTIDRSAIIGPVVGGIHENQNTNQE